MERSIGRAAEMSLEWNVPAAAQFATSLRSDLQVKVFDKIQTDRKPSSLCVHQKSARSDHIKYFLINSENGGYFSWRSKLRISIKFEVSLQSHFQVKVFDNIQSVRNRPSLYAFQKLADSDNIKYFLINSENGGYFSWWSKLRISMKFEVSLQSHFQFKHFDKIQIVRQGSYKFPIIRSISI